MSKLKPHDLVDQKEYLSPETDDLVNEFVEYYEYALEDTLWQTIEDLILEDQSFYPKIDEVHEFILTAIRRFKSGKYRKPKPA